MNLSEIFIRRPIATTLIMLGVLFFGIMGYRMLPVSDLPNVDYPIISVNASPRRRVARDDGVRRRDAAREAVLDHRGPRRDDVDVEPGQHEHHDAVRARPRHQRGRRKTCRRR
jgi:hypothetical protein